MREREEGAALMVSSWLTPCAEDGGYLNVVDIFNATAGTWSTAALSVARAYLAATSLPSAGLAFFAGGEGGTCLLCLFELIRDCLNCEGARMSGRRVLCC